MPQYVGGKKDKMDIGSLYILSKLESREFAELDTVELLAITCRSIANCGNRLGFQFRE